MPTPRTFFFAMFSNYSDNYLLSLVGVLRYSATSHGVLSVDWSRFNIEYKQTTRSASLAMDMHAIVAAIQEF